jgi:hypothetical protein
LTAVAQDPLAALKDLYFRKTSLKQTQIRNLELEDLKLLRGIVFGRHGRVFKDAGIKYENKIYQELSSKPIATAVLEGLFIEDASQKRQAIYARHGKVLKEPWLQKYFSSFDWYKADPNFSEAALTEVEKKNIATIAAYEKRAVTAMSTIEG